MSDKSKADKLLAIADSLAKERQIFAPHWQQISRVASINGDGQFTTDQPTSGNTQNRHIYDSTGVHANQLLASGFFSMLTSPNSPWFTLSTNDEYLNRSREMGEWLADASKVLAFEIQRPQTNFTAALNEFYLEYGNYGNGTTYETRRKDLNCLLFQTIPLRECSFGENDEGFIDTLVRSYTRSPYQLLEKFGESKVSKEVSQKMSQDPFKNDVQILHFILPNRSFLPESLGMRGMAYSSIYMEKETGNILLEEGYEEKPFFSARFYKLPNETYGRGPGSMALPDLNMLQEIEKADIRSIQKMVDPPLQLPDQGFLNPVRVNPGALNYYRIGSEARVEPLFTGGRPDIGEDKANNIRQRIREMYFVDQLQLNVGPQMTATEVIQRTEEKSRLLGPVVGRASTEYLSPLIARSFGLLMRMGKIPQPPQDFLDSQALLTVVYVSPIMKAQEQVAANNLLRVTQVLQPFLAADPNSMDIWNIDRTSKIVGDMFSIDPRMFNSEEELQALREGRAEQQNQMAGAEQLKNTGIGINNLAMATQNMGESGLL